MKINKKLSVIASLVPKGDNVIDIGCDHALLDIFLTLYNDNSCIASDIKKSAIDGAFQNSKKYHVEDKIDFIVSDGFKNINVKTNASVIISGMGTSTIKKILMDAPHDKIKSFIISSNNDLMELRTFMMELGYLIEEEIVVFEKGIYYVIIKFIKGHIRYQVKELKYGPILLKYPSMERDSYYRYLISYHNDLIKKLPGREIKKKVSVV